MAATRQMESDLTFFFTVDIIARTNRIRNKVPLMKSRIGYFAVIL
jgi:hypothetical protein